MKKTLSLLFVLLLSMSCFASCSIPGLGGDAKNDTLVYGKGVVTDIIVSATADSFDTSDISDAVFEACGVVVGLKNDGFEKSGSEIVIGETKRAVTASAKDAMRKALRSAVLNSADEEEAEKDLVAYAVYAEGGSLALVWSSDVVKDLALEYLIGTYIKDESLDSASVISDVQVVSLDEYYEKMVEDQKASEWEKLRQGFISFGCSEKEAGECVAAVQKFYAMADEKVYLWVANLYDPDIGGFYYSNSGRDTAGFLPDIESTFQALNMLQSSGMFDEFGDDTEEKLQNALPKDMQAKIVSFVKGCQSEEDGYFHHPQWEGIDSGWTSRLNRDLSWAIGILDWFDAEPFYSLPTVRGVSAKNALIGNLGASKVSMVSKVVAVDAIPDYFATPELWRAHLESYDWETMSYQTANTIGSQTNMIRSRGQEYIDVLEEVLTEKQKPHNGLWEEGVYYASVNGLMKTCAAMNALGIKLNYAEKAFESAIAMAKHTGKDDEGFVANHIVDVYNPWYAMDDIMTNAAQYGDPEVAEALRETLVSEAAELIEISMLKTAPFKKLDGSFGYNYDASPHTSQGAPVSVPGTVEGDVNGCVMALNGVIGNLLDTFGIERPRRYFMDDYIRFIDELENLGAVIKSNVGIPAETVTFDEEIEGTTEPMAFSMMNIPYSGLGQIEVKEGTEDDMVFHIKDNSGTDGTSVRLTPGGVPVGASRCVIEFDINVKSSSDGIFYQIFMGSTYQLTLASEGNSVRIGDSSTKGVENDFGVTFNKGEWHKVRIEYFFTGEESTTVTKIFLDGYLRALSNNYYGKLSDKATTPVLNFAEVHFYTLFNPVVDVYLDNIYANKDNGIYVEEETVNPYRVTDFDNTEEGKLPHGISGKLYKDDAVCEITDDPSPSENDGAYGKVLHFAAATGAAEISKKIESLVTDGNRYVFSADIYIKDCSDKGAITQTYFRTESGALFALTFAGGSDASGKYVDLTVLNTENNSAGAHLARIDLGEWVNLTIEYYRFQYEVGEDGNLWSGVKARVLVNGTEEFNGLCAYPNPNTLSKSAVSFYNYVLNGQSIDMYFDNMVFELSDGIYVDESGNEIPDPETPAFPKGSSPTSTPASKDHNGSFDFENAELGSPIVPGLSTLPNENEYGNIIEIAEDPQGDKAIKLISIPSTVKGNSVTFEASKQSSETANCQIFEFTINVKKAAGAENYLQLYMLDAKGGIVASYNVLFSKGVNGDVTVTSRNTVGAALDGRFSYTGGDVKIRLEYYETNGITKLYVDDSFIAEGAACYSGGNVSADTVSVKITALMKSEFELYIDNVTVNATQKSYVSGN